MPQTSHAAMRLAGGHRSAEHPLLWLQRTAGNRAVLALMQAAAPQPAAEENHRQGHERRFWAMTRAAVTFGVFLVFSAFKSSTRGRIRQLRWRRKGEMTPQPGADRLARFSAARLSWRPPARVEQPRPGNGGTED